MALIAYHDVGFSAGDRKVFKGFNLEVREGEKVLIFGRSGTGKSTILKMLLGFTRPDSGRVSFEGREVDRRNVWEVRRRVAYVSQDLDMADGRVRDFLDWTFGIKANRGIVGSWERLRGYMEWMELGQEIIDTVMADLSGGEKQRLALAVALSLGREVFLLDEVTSAVDPRMRSRIVDLFTNLKTSTVLAVSHDETWLRAAGIRVMELRG
ncbi:MAG: ABC transporter ATP-binding protein [Actinobacteria bacterium]|nr:ABC transporter ATP-binding protein [Actinomycetota bacterium]